MNNTSVAGAPVLGSRFESIMNVCKAFYGKHQVIALALIILVATSALAAVGQTTGVVQLLGRKPVVIATSWTGKPVVWMDSQGVVHGHLHRGWWGGLYASARTRELTDTEVADRLKVEAAIAKKDAAAKEKKAKAAEAKAAKSKK